MNKNKLTFSATGLLIFFLLSLTAFALPTISSELDQDFQKNQTSTQLRNLTITEDGSSINITQGAIRITIPDTIAIIFDSTRTGAEILLHGTAVDNEKIAQNPAVTFENGDKTLVIPVSADFDLGESVVVTKVFVEGFNENSTSSSRIFFQINDSSVQYLDDKHINIVDSSLEDENVPDMPTNITVENHADGVKIAWTDPTDLDLQTVDILRGKGSSPINATPYTQVADGVEEFIDTDVMDGETVKYILRANDGLNLSTNSAEIELIVGPVTEEPPVEEEPVEEEPVEEEPVEEEPVEEEPTEEETPAPEFTDISGHWAQQQIMEMAEMGIVLGNPDKTFAPDASLNRAESAAILYRVTGFEEALAPAEKPFSDVMISAWYAGYVSDLKDLDLIHGNPDGTYRPENNVNRAEFLTLAMNVYYYLADAEGKAEIDELKAGEATKAYVDLQTDWYTPIVTAATAKGFVSGSNCAGLKCFNADSEITRAEATVILHGMFAATM